MTERTDAIEYWENQSVQTLKKERDALIDKLVVIEVFINLLKIQDQEENVHEGSN